MSFLMMKDVNGMQTFSIMWTQQGTHKYNAILTYGCDYTLTIPSEHEKYNVIITIEPGSIVWVSVGNPAQTPAVGNFILCNSEFNPVGRVFNGGDVLHFTTTDDTIQVGVRIDALK
jgi:hypothetical protein